MVREMVGVHDGVVDGAGEAAGSAQSVRLAMDTVSAGHVKHVELPVFGAYKPAAHSVQLASPLADTVPLGQGRHASAPVVLV